MALRRKVSEASVPSIKGSLAGNAELTPSLFGSSRYEMVVVQRLICLLCSQYAVYVSHRNGQYASFRGQILLEIHLSTPLGSSWMATEGITARMVF